MKGRTMIVRFLSLGPTDSAFSIPCVQCTDSFYVAHSEDLLYRPGYEQFKRAGRRRRSSSASCTRRASWTSAWSAPSRTRSASTSTTPTTPIYSVNTQYAGNTVGLKKLALRLAIRKADREGWLAEHMFLMGVHGPGGRKTYFAGAFPSACGKTSTAMLPGETILGDDIAYFRDVDGECPRRQRRVRHLRHHPERQRQGRPGHLGRAHQARRGHLLQRPGQGRQALLAGHGDASCPTKA